MNAAFKNTKGKTCKSCYACVRACPSKAIRITGGLAQIDVERCVHCGQCILVCSHGEWEVKRDQALVRALLNSKDPVAVVLDTAFPAAFPDIDITELVGKLRKLGFDKVVEASFGADLVSAHQKNQLTQPRDSVQISSWCPAVVDFIRKFSPDQIPLLSSTLPPVVAMSRVMRKLHGDDIRIVYVSPCVAHKKLKTSPSVTGEIDAVLTFLELAEMLAADTLVQSDSEDCSKVQDSDFDPPFGKNGVYSGLPLGVATASGYECNPVDTLVTDASGPRRSVRVLNSITTGDIDHGFVDMLFCRGCVDGCAVLHTNGSRQRGRNAVLKYARYRSERFDQQEWQTLFEDFSNLDLNWKIEPDPCFRPSPDKDDLKKIRKDLDEFGEHQFIDCSACGYHTCRDFIEAVGKNLAELDMCTQYQLRKLRGTIGDLEASHRRVSNMVDVLHHSEKLANLAQLSAATAYKLNDPLSVVLLYSHLLQEEHAKTPELREDLNIIVQQVEKVKEIFIDLLNLSARNRILPESVDARELVDRTLMLVSPPAGVDVEIVFDLETPHAELDREQIGCVLTNLLENAYEAVGEKGTVKIHATGDNDFMKIRISDNGPGIRKHDLNKIFDPFFTTKRVGIGAGLGLAVAREIARQHHGNLSVTSNDNPSRGPTGTTFELTIPRQNADVVTGGFSNDGK